MHAMPSVKQPVCRPIEPWPALLPQPVLTFDLGNSVGDVGWSPHSSTVFAAVTTDGKVRSTYSGRHEHSRAKRCAEYLWTPGGITRMWKRSAAAPAAAADAENHLRLQASARTHTAVAQHDGGAL